LTIDEFFNLLGGATLIAFIAGLVMIFVHEYDIRRREKS